MARSIVWCFPPSPVNKVIISLLLPTIVLTLNGVSPAYPPFAVEHGNSCAVCHGTSPDNGGLDGGGEERSDAMSVLSATVFDPDESTASPPADWKDRGALKTFTARPGQTVELTMQVENGPIEYAIQLKRFEKEGFSGSGNKLAGHFTPDPSWQAQGTGETTYFTNSVDDFDGHDFPVGSVIPFTYSLTLAADTPLDVYDLEFATAGRDSAATYGKWYDDEHFYLNVVPEPCTNVLIGLGLITLCLRKRKRSTG